MFPCQGIPRISPLSMALNTTKIIFKDIALARNFDLGRDPLFRIGVAIPLAVHVPLVVYVPLAVHVPLAVPLVVPLQRSSLRGEGVPSYLRSMLPCYL